MDQSPGEASGARSAVDAVGLSGWTVYPDTVSELVEALQGLLRDEDERANSLNTRGSALIGFIGVILSVATAAGVAGGADVIAGLDDGVRELVGVLLALAFLVLLWALATLSFKVLKPVLGETIHINEAKRFGTFGFISRDPLHTRGYLMRGYIAALETERARNNKKAEALTKVYMIVLSGLALVAAAGVAATFVAAAGVAATLDRYVAGAGAAAKSVTHSPTGNIGRP